MRRCGPPARPRAAAGIRRIGAQLSAAGLRRLLGELGAAKQRLLREAAALREVERRVRDWDAREAFQARRSRALRTEATLCFSRALDGLEILLGRLPRDDRGGAARARPRGLRARRLLIAICAELRYLQQAFDGGNLQLARALTRFAAHEA